MSKRNEESKLYDLFVTRQLGGCAPVLFKVETVSAKSAEEAHEKGEQDCLRYAAQANGRYVYKCKVSETEAINVALRRKKDWEAAVKEVIGDDSHS